MWRITQYKTDENARPYGEAFMSDCYTQELAESYKGLPSCEKIEQYIGHGKWQQIYPEVCAE